MLLKSVKVENFQCIEDSGEFSLAQVTCMVGKNESGKSTLLEALYHLKPVVAEERNFELLTDYPRRRLADYQDRLKRDPNSPHENVLTTVWELGQLEKAELTELLGPDSITDYHATLRKGYDNRRIWNITIDEYKVVQYYVQAANLHAEELAQINGKDTISELISILSGISEPSTRQINLLEKLKLRFGTTSALVTAYAILDRRLPTFVFFADYQKMRGEVHLETLLQRKANNQLDFSDKIFLALLDLASASAEEIQQAGKFEELIAKLEAVSNRISREIFTYWSQNKHLEVEFRFDNARPNDLPPYNTGYIFRTRIRNTRHKVSVNFDERSAGFVWFFSFLVWFSQVRQNYGENLFILLDEPGLSLHARAQSDLLRYINEKLQPQYQVVYSAHSPFMVDPENILNVRTVEDVVINDEVLGTKVGDKVFSTDPDTIFPLQAALGYDISQTLFVGKYTLLVEGPSDLLYLKWFSKELATRGRTNLDPNWVISPCGGIDKIASFVALFSGKKLNIAVLTDMHSGDKRKVQNLRESTLLKAGHVFSADMYTGLAESDVEDIIGRDVYITLINNCYSLNGGSELPPNRSTSAPATVLAEVEAHFRILPPTSPNFDHLTPSIYLVEKGTALINSLPEIEQALDKFEKFFAEINALIK